MKLYNTGESSMKPSIVMVVYGEGGVGKTSFTATAPHPILADCENGAKYFGLRGIKMDVAQIEKWGDMNFTDGFGALARSDKYETVIIDPVGELMDKLKRHMCSLGDSKLVNKDGSPTMAGWGWLKDTLKSYIKVLRDSGKNVIIVAHLAEERDEDRVLKRIKVETKLRDDLKDMVDIVAYMTILQDGETGQSKRVLIIDPANDKYVAKDRTGQLGKFIEPDFQKIINACQGTATYAWSKQLAPLPPAVPQTTKPETAEVKYEMGPTSMAVPVKPATAPTVEPEVVMEPLSAEQIAESMGGTILPERAPLANAKLEAARTKLTAKRLTPKKL